MKLFDVVALVESIPEQGLEAGSVGAIIDVFDQPRREFEVEFTDAEGATIAMVVLRPEQVRLHTIG